jgi:lariat debranching enzyme
MASLTHKIFASLKAGNSFSPTVPEAQNGDAKVSPSPAVTSSSSSPTAAWNERFYHVAVQGCCHGELDRIYDACAAHERQTGKRIDVLICCGDFQAVRTARDLDSMAVPDKYKEMGDFHKYWSLEICGTARAAAAPYLTVFVGGNHENSDLLAQESYGGFVAPNIYYLGHSGVVIVDKCLRVAGLSGIFKEQDYDRPYPPRPYAAENGWKKGAYHVRHIEVAKLHAYLRAIQALQQGEVETDKDTSAAPPLVDIFVSHDWPVGITAYGDEAQLLRFKPYFRDDIRRHALGNPHTMNLLREAKPVYWVAAHLHCFFEASVSHTFTRSSSSEANTAAASSAPTKFVALDKCAKGSGFLTFLDLPRRQRDSTVRLDPTVDADDAAAAGCADSTAEQVDRRDLSGASRIQRDPLWLEVLKASHPFVAQNRTAEASGASQGVSPHLDGGQWGFDVNKTVRELVARHTLPSLLSPLSSTAAVMAPSTEALLRELQLAPALPLQQQEVPFRRPAAAHDRCGQGRKEGPSRIGPRANAGGAPEAYRQHQRPRTEASALMQDVVTALSNPSVAPAPSAPLSFFEDVGAVAPSSAPASLGWFEDTTQ